MAELVRALAGLDPLLVYGVLALGASLENVVPPVPADTFVLFGAFLAGAGRADAWAVLAVTWAGNVGSAAVVYAMARRFGEPAFHTPVGRFLLRPRQLRQLGRFYDRWGAPAIFISRFLPALRALVPLFAGVSGASAWRVLPPLALASALWYGGLVYLGATLGRNWEGLLEVLSSINAWLLAAALAVAVAIGTWWWRTRHHAETEGG